MALSLYSFYHLNLAFSSIPVERRADVIEKCYWPLLRICRDLNVPVGIEASGFTLETIAEVDPTWIAELRLLVESGMAEFIGCGYAQTIGPLLPARANWENLRIGMRVYQDLLGLRPKLALVNEQAYASGLVPLYREAGFDAIIMEWDNAARSNPDWDPIWRYFPQRALGPSGERISLVWNKSIAFQKFQRYAHGEMTLSSYVDYLGRHAATCDGAFPLYGNDAECFDFRPGRFMTEAPLKEPSEWKRIEHLYAQLRQDDRFQLILPSEALALLDQPLAGKPLTLQSASQPIPTKKQDKYNPLRWSVTGRDDIGINTACWRLHDALSKSDASVDAEWKELCYLWSSDFRTHITEPRWIEYQSRLQSFAERFADSPVSAISVSGNEQMRPETARDGKLLHIRGQRLEVTLNCARGLAIDQFIDHAVSPISLLGTLEHGYYDDIQWGADFYSGHLVFEAPGKAKATDLSAVEPEISWDGTILKIHCLIKSGIGNISKTWLFDDANGRLGLSGSCEVPAPALGSLRLGHVTLNPEAFDRSSLFFRTHNGGLDAETFEVPMAELNHGRPVSFLVSANQAIGITEGLVEMGDADLRVRINIDKRVSALIGLMSFSPVRNSYFYRLSLSAQELDDTSRPCDGKKIDTLLWLSAAKNPTGA